MNFKIINAKSALTEIKVALFSTGKEKAETNSYCCPTHY
jgi:hypothetical protein